MPPASHFSLICFDLDGTLIDSRKDISNSVNRMLTELGLPEKPELLIATYIGNGVTNLIRQSLGEDHEKLFRQALEIFRQDYDEHCLDATKLYPGIRETLKILGMTKTVVTNKPLRFSEKILKGFSIRNYFDYVLGGDMKFPKKPAPDAVLHLMNACDITDSKKVLFVGDSLLDIQTGKNAGVKTCAVTYGFGNRRELEDANPDYVIEKFSELVRFS